MTDTDLPKEDDVLRRMLNTPHKERKLLGNSKREPKKGPKGPQ